MENRGEEKSCKMEIVYLTYFNNFFTFTFLLEFFLLSSPIPSTQKRNPYASHSYFDLEKKERDLRDFTKRKGIKRDFFYSFRLHGIEICIFDNLQTFCKEEKKMKTLIGFRIKDFSVF